jgi:hypothetical protein
MYAVHFQQASIGLRYGMSELHASKKGESKGRMQVMVVKGVVEGMEAGTREEICNGHMIMGVNKVSLLDLPFEEAKRALVTEFNKLRAVAGLSYVVIQFAIPPTPQLLDKLSSLPTPNGKRNKTPSTAQLLSIMRNEWSTDSGVEGSGVEDSGVEAAGEHVSDNSEHILGTGAASVRSSRKQMRQCSEECADDDRAPMETTPAKRPKRGGDDYWGTDEENSPIVAKLFQNNANVFGGDDAAKNSFEAAAKLKRTRSPRKKMTTSASTLGVLRELPQRGKLHGVERKNSKTEMSARTSQLQSGSKLAAAAQVAKPQTIGAKACPSPYQCHYLGFNTGRQLMMLMAQLLLPLQQKRCQKLRYLWRWSSMVERERELEGQQEREKQWRLERAQDVRGKQQQGEGAEEIARLKGLQQRTVQKNASLQQLCEELEADKLRMSEAFEEERQLLRGQKQQMAMQLAAQRERAAALTEEVEHTYGMCSAKQEQQTILEKRVQQLLVEQRQQTRHSFLEQKRDVAQTLMGHAIGPLMEPLMGQQFEQGGLIGQQFEQQLVQCQLQPPPPLPPPARPPSSFKSEEHQQQRWLNAAKLRASSQYELRQQEMIYAHGARFMHAQSLLRQILQRSFVARMRPAMQAWKGFVEDTASEDVDKYFTLGRSSTPAPAKCPPKISHHFTPAPSHHFTPAPPDESEAGDADVERYFRLAQSGRRGVCT